MPSGNLYFKNGIIVAQKPFASSAPDPIRIFDDFLMDVLADDPLVTVTQSGTAVTAAAVSATAGDPVAGLGGWIAGGTDDVDAEVDEVAVGGLGTGAGTPWLRADALGTGKIVVEWGLTVPAALTARQYFAGISDDPVEGTATNGAMSIQTGTTITDVATDAAGLIFSSLATNPTIWKYGATDSGTQDTATDTSVTQVADTYIGCRTEIDVNGDCYFFTRTRNRHGSLTFQGKSANGLSPDVLLVPYFSAAPTTTTSVPWEIDYCLAAQLPE